MASHLLSGSDPVSSRQYPRLTSSQEWFCLIVLSVILTIIASISGRGRAVVYSLMAVSVLLTHYMVFLHLHHWLPGITALLMVVTASITSIQVPPKRKGEFMKDLPFKRYSGK